jgi:poly(3-hydroxybutyrate) depolymerase
MRSVIARVCFVHGKLPRDFSTRWSRFFDGVRLSVALLRKRLAVGAGSSRQAMQLIRVVSFTGLVAVMASQSGCSSDGSTPETSGGTGTAGNAGHGAGNVGTGGSGATGGSSAATGGSGGSGGTGGSSGGSAGTSAGGAGASGQSSSAGRAGGGAPSGGRENAGAGRGDAGGSSGGPTSGSGGRGGASGAASGGAATGGAGAGAAGMPGSAGTSSMMSSPGCGKSPTLSNSPASTNFKPNTLSVGGKNREFIIRWPDAYDKSHPYRLILGLHGAGGSDKDTAGDYFGLWSLSMNSTIFVALSADGGYWSATTDVAYTDAVLKAVEEDLCIDTSRVMLEGFSQGAAMSWTIACSRPDVFRAVVGHSGGGVANPTTCQPVAYLGSLGLSESGNSQKTQTDQFAKWNGCTVATLPTAPSGGHVCTPYQGCPASDPVVWCSYDGGHTPSPTDGGQQKSWMPAEVWSFLSPF